MWLILDGQLVFCRQAVKAGADDDYDDGMRLTRKGETN